MSAKVKFHKNAWWIFAEFQGKRWSKKCLDRKHAEALALQTRDRQIAAKLGLTPAYQMTQSFADYSREWLTHIAATRKATTSRFYAVNLKHHIVPVIGPKPVSSITRADCRQVLQAAQAKQLKRNTIYTVLRTLSAILSNCVEDGLLPANPAFRMGKHIRQTAEPRVINPWTREEVATFLASVKEHAPAHYPLFLTALRTGLRLGELLGLQVNDLDLAGRSLTVRRNLVGGRVTSPKNGRTRRVDLSAQLVQTLETHVAGRKPEAWVFQAPEGGPLDGDNLRRRVFVPAVKKAKVRMIRIHDLRHTFASLLIQQGESLAYVRDQMGHSSIQVTVDVYGKLVPGANRGAVDRLDDREAI